MSEKRLRLHLISLSYISPSASSLLSGMDATKDPCEDFFQYACGTWNKKHVIPEDRSSISTFEVSWQIYGLLPTTFICVHDMEDADKLFSDGNQSNLIVLRNRRKLSSTSSDDDEHDMESLNLHPMQQHKSMDGRETASEA